MTKGESARLAIVETKVDQVEDQVEQVRSELLSVGNDVRAIRDSLHKQRGFISGVVAAFTFMWTLIGGLFAYFWMR